MFLKTLQPMFWSHSLLCAIPLFSLSAPHPFVFGNHDNISSSASAPKRRIYSVAMAI